MTDVTQHEVGDGCSWIHCYYHDVDEPARLSKVHRVCGECNHEYVTAEDLVDAWRAEAPPDAPPPAADKIYYCQYCLHDF